MPRFEPRHINTRRAVLKLFSEGVSGKDICARHKITAPTFFRWAKEIGLERGSNETAEQIDDRLRQWSAKRAKLGAHKPGNLKSERAAARKKRRVLLTKPKKEVNPLSLNKKMADPVVYTQALEHHYNEMAAKLDRETSMVGQVQAMSAGMLLASLREAIENPPPITSWTDVEKCIKLLRLTLNMDAEGGKGPSEGPDLRILNAKTTKRKIIEVHQEKDPLPEIKNLDIPQ